MVPKLGKGRLKIQRITTLDYGFTPVSMISTTVDLVLERVQDELMTSMTSDFVFRMDLAGRMKSVIFD